MTFAGNSVSGSCLPSAFTFVVIWQSRVFASTSTSGMTRATFLTDGSSPGLTSPYAAPPLNSVRDVRQIVSVPLPESPAHYNDEISKLYVVCASCGAWLNHNSRKNLCIHKVMKVISCKRCYSYYSDDNVQKYESGKDNCCHWCAEGGSLVLCDICSCAFCKTCIRRNMSLQELARIKAPDEWRCYVCNPDPLVPLVNYTNMIIDYSSELQKQVPTSSTYSSAAMKLRETDVMKLPLQKAAEIQSSVSELAQGWDGKGLLGQA